MMYSVYILMKIIFISDNNQFCGKWFNNKPDTVIVGHAICLEGCNEKKCNICNKFHEDRMKCLEINQPASYELVKLDGKCTVPN